jgi:putative transposase
LLPASIDLHEHDARTGKIGQARLKVLAVLAAAERTSNASIAAAAWELGVSRGYCYRLLRRYRKNPTLTKLMPQARGRTTGAKILDPAVEALVEQAIDEFYLTPERPSVAGLV